MSRLVSGGVVEELAGSNADTSCGRAFQRPASAREWRYCNTREAVMNIGIIGSGDVGQALASGFIKHGHEVVIGTRDPAKLYGWGKANPKGRVGGFSEAAQLVS